MYKNSIVDIIAINLILIVCGLAYYFHYVKPRTEMLLEIASCMNEISDNTEAGYALCHERFIEERG